MAFYNLLGKTVQPHYQKAASSVIHKWYYLAQFLSRLYHSRFRVETGLLYQMIKFLLLHLQISKGVWCHQQHRHGYKEEDYPLHQGHFQLFKHTILCLSKINNHDILFLYFFSQVEKSLCITHICKKPSLCPFYVHPSQYTIHLQCSF